MKIYSLLVSTQYLKTRLRIFFWGKGVSHTRWKKWKFTKKVFYYLKTYCKHLSLGIAFVALSILIALFNQMHPN